MLKNLYIYGGYEKILVYKDARYHGEGVIISTTLNISSIINGDIKYIFTDDEELVKELRK